MQKLRLVLQGHAPRSLLSTYDSERRQVAEDFIAFDRGYLKLFCAHSNSFEDGLRAGMTFSTGISIRYPSSSIVKPARLSKGSVSHSRVQPSLLKVDLAPGKRLPDFQIVCHADGVTTRAHQRLHACGSFRILVFAGNVSREYSFVRLQRLGSWLADQTNGLGSLTGGGNDALLEAIVIHSADRATKEILEFHEVFRPWSDTKGTDYWRIYADVDSAHEGWGRAYERLELDPEEGRVVLVRPDNYVGALFGIEDFEGIQDYFAPFTKLVESF